jgi:glycosyltransferase involved in cell wall biosynthesis
MQQKGEETYPGGPQWKDASWAAIEGFEGNRRSNSNDMEVATKIKQIAFLGSHLPRQCGIATFTSDLCQAIATQFPHCQCIVGAMNDRPEGYDYPARIRFEIDEKEVDSYRRAADFLNVNNVEIVSVQHEFGIFGGPAGGHLLALLRDVHMPVVTTLHTVLRKPNSDQRILMDHLDELSSRFIVMAERGRDFLEKIYRIASEKIDVIPHGIPEMPFIDPNFHKDQFGVEGKMVLLTFGLLSPNKGIEYVIEALPAILEQNPHVVYIILGATHPNIIASEGESYRLKLERLAKDRGVASHVIFYNRFVTLEELKDFIGAADIYITPYLNESQITSGTLAYAFGAGKAVISTPYWHAKELLANDRGILVPFANAKAITEGVKRFLSDPVLMTATRKKAWKLGRGMTWSVVAQGHIESFERARASLSVSPRKAFAARTLDKRPYELPPQKLDHLIRMTDHTGIFQHAIFNVPNFAHGYCTKDNARAFILTLLLEETASVVSRPQFEHLANIYLAFLWNAFDQKTLRFRNFLSHQRHWPEPEGSEDSHAQALWAAGTALGRSKNEGYRNLCALLFQRGLPIVENFRSPRAWAFALLAIQEYLRAFSGDRSANQLREVLTNRLVELFRIHSSPDWVWFEPVATYDNARLSQAMILSGYWTSRGDVVEIGLRSLRWLVLQQKAEAGHFAPIGTHGFRTRGGESARFDQQPLEAYAMIAACVEAYLLTGDSTWYRAARRCFEWFLGRNDLGQSLYDSRTGGCSDALHCDRVSQNQGTEASLAFHLSATELARAEACSLKNSKGQEQLADQLYGDRFTQQHRARTESIIPLGGSSHSPNRKASSLA